MKFIIDNILLVFVALTSGALLLWPLIVRGASGTLVSHLQATQLINAGNACLVDIRTSDEFARGHIAGAKNIPLEQLSSRLAELSKFQQGTVILAGTNKAPAQTTLALLKERGFNQVLSLEGGVEAWRTAGLPLVK